MRPKVEYLERLLKSILEEVPLLDQTSTKLILNLFDLVFDLRHQLDRANIELSMIKLKENEIEEISQLVIIVVPLLIKEEEATTEVHSNFLKLKWPHMGVVPLRFEASGWGSTSLLIKKPSEIMIEFKDGRVICYRDYRAKLFKN